MTPQIGALLVALDNLQQRVTLDKAHRYRVDRLGMPGVTTIIRVKDAPALDRWKVRVQVEGTARAAWRNPPDRNRWDYEDESELLAAEVAYIDLLAQIAKEEYEHDRIANAAADVGQQVHALIEHEMRKQLGQPTGEPEVGDAALFAFAGFKEWQEKVKLQPLMAEGRVYHAAAGFCGTVDALCLMDGEPMVLDWKPTPSLWAERRLQSAAYRKALTSLGWPEMRGAIVCLPRDGGEIAMLETEKPGPELDDCFEAFLALLRVYRWEADLAKRERKAAKEEAA